MPAANADDAESAPQEYGSVTQWIAEVKQPGNELAQRQILQRYWNRLSGLARGKLRTARTRAFDEEDVVVQTLHAFFAAAENGRCPEMRHRDDLWNYLVRIAERKAIDLARGEQREKRGGGRVLGEASAFPSTAARSHGGGLENVPELRDPSPELAEQLAVCCYDLLSSLDDEERVVAVMKGEGYSNADIANRIGRVERSVERKLKAIRGKLAKVSDDVAD